MLEVGLDALIVIVVEMIRWYELEYQNPNC
jgi:hypothetical protein